MSVLRKDFEARHAYWQATLTDMPEIKRLLTEAAYLPAMEFFEAYSQDLTPAVQADDHTAISRALNAMRASYRLHREKIVELIPLAEQHAAALEQAAKNQAYIAALISVRPERAFFTEFTGVFCNRQARMKRDKRL